MRKRTVLAGLLLGISGMSVAFAQQPGGLQPKVVAPLSTIVAEPEIGSDDAPAAEAPQPAVAAAPRLSPRPDLPTIVADPEPAESFADASDSAAPSAVEQEIDRLPPPPRRFADTAADSAEPAPTEAAPPRTLQPPSRGRGPALAQAPQADRYTDPMPEEEYQELADAPARDRYARPYENDARQDLAEAMAPRGRYADPRYDDGGQQLADATRAARAPDYYDHEVLDDPAPPPAAPRWRDRGEQLASRAPVSATRLPDLRAQVVGWVRARFASLDRDGDGFLVEDELAAGDGASFGRRVRQRFAGRQGWQDGYGDEDGYSPQPRAILGTAFARMDRNRDGAVSFSEAVNNALERFDRMDADEDGVIEADERSGARRYAGLDPTLGQRRFARAPAPRYDDRDDY